MDLQLELTDHQQAAISRRRERWLRFHEANPHVYAELVKLARRGKNAGAGKLGIKMLFEVLRWRHTLRTRGDDFKLNNNYHAYYARLIMDREPDLDGIFEIREQIAETRGL